MDSEIWTYRQSLIDLGKNALQRLEGDCVAESYKAAFWRLMKKGEHFFPEIICADIRTEVICYLRLSYGVVLMNWLLVDNNGGDEEESA